MKKHKMGAVKLFFLFATLGAFPFLYPAMQFQQRNSAMNSGHNFELRLKDRLAPLPKAPAVSVLVPIDPALGSEVKPDPIE